MTFYDRKIRKVIFFFQNGGHLQFSILNISKNIYFHKTFIRLYNNYTHIKIVREDKVRKYIFEHNLINFGHNLRLVYLFDTAAT